ncbi:MAG: tRNA lysidine(34) synthetase TilS [Cyclobacteriaceae bacterium]
MIERVKDFIRANDLLKKDEQLLVAVSGGLDSMALLHVLKSLDYDVAVAHVNFQLRGDDSDLDEEHVKKTCENLGIAFFSKKAALEKAGGSIQMAAREVRYEFFDGLIEAHAFDKIVTAHHLNDSLETVLLNLSRGTGIAGLTGISAINGKVVRPMLCLTRSEILDFANEHAIVWREDATNKESKYQRNLIRNEVIPKLETINPSLLNTFTSTLERLQGSQEVLEWEVQNMKSKYLKLGDPIELDLSWMDSSKKSQVLLSELLKEFEASFLLCTEIIESTESGKQFRTPTHLMNLDRHKLLVRPIGESTNPELTISGLGKYRWGSYSIQVEQIAHQQVDLKSEARLAQLDADKIDFPLRVRSWRQGDEFKPLGMNGTKKVSDFFIDEKVPLLTKEDIPIFESKDRIVWIGGYRISEDFKVTSSTEKVLRLTLV